MNKTQSLTLSALLFLLLASADAHADTILFANMTHSQETVRGTFVTSTMPPLPRPESFGTATFVLNDARTMLTFSATIFNIDVTGSQTPNDMNDNLVAAHIHVGAPPGMNAPVRWGFFGTPDNDNNPDNLIIIPFLNGVGGTISSTWDLPEGNGGTTLTAQLPGILGGSHTLTFTLFSSAAVKFAVRSQPCPNLRRLSCSAPELSASARRFGVGAR